MPKIPGRPDTKRKFKVEDLLIGSFLMQNEEWFWRRVCVVEGCDHRMGPKTDEPGWVNWKSCDETQLPAFASHKDRLHETAGAVCPCHVAEILDRA